MQLGITTDTYDTTGNVIRVNKEKAEALFKDRELLPVLLDDIFMHFTGRIVQKPPIYSAIKVDGKKLYEYAREGIDVEIPLREVEIYSLELTDMDPDRCEISFSVECSKGTYVRSLIHDIGTSLGTGAAMSSLLRDEINGVYSRDSLTLDELNSLKSEDRLYTAVQTMESIISYSPMVHLKEEGKKYLLNGNRLSKNMLIFPDNEDIYRNTDFIRVYNDDELSALYTYDIKHDDFRMYKNLMH